MDVARFSTVTSALMEHGQEGSEAMAGIMRQIYEPTVRAVYDLGGIITGYAGDNDIILSPSAQSSLAEMVQGDKAGGCAGRS